MPRKSSKTKGARGPAAPKPHGKSAVAAASVPYPDPAHEYPYDTEVAGAGADGAADALERLDLDVSTTAAAEGAPVETPPPQPEVPASRLPPQLPMEASSSGSGAAGGGREEEALRRLQELVAIGREEVELTEEEVRANDQRQEDEVMRWSLSHSSFATHELFSTLRSMTEQLLCHGYEAVVNFIFLLVDLLIL